MHTENIVFTNHSLERMKKYDISKDEVVEALMNPDEIIPGYMNRLIAQKYYGEYILRVIYEKINNICVITVYRARRKRYEKR